MLVLCYPKCSTCRKALNWLDERNIEFDQRDIVQDNPTIDELRLWHKSSDLPLRRFLICTAMIAATAAASAAVIRIVPRFAAIQVPMSFPSCYFPTTTFPVNFVASLYFLKNSM